MRISDNLTPAQMTEAWDEWRSLLEQLTAALETGAAEEDAEKFHGLLDELWERSLQLVESRCLSFESAAQVASQVRALKYHPNCPELWYA